ncbi:MAG: UbiH/UbiF/VisC/COQ6 family ubiquinone biosynthesis hydroxylase [Proteobacteria bacterium]|nr:UbiH/UbiF/VisC/COQ6 family ubiquinone biosynthesis hydroxylase [Pseudomonadota bacterium]
MNTSLNSFDVTIIGGGAIGALFALSLVHDCFLKKTPSYKIALIDQTPLETLLNPATDGRTFALTTSAYSLLQKLGIWEKLDAKASPILNILVTEGAHQEGLHYDHESVQKPFGYIVESSLLRKEIFLKLQSSKQITFLTPTKLDSLKREKSHMALYLQDGTCLTTRLLVGADGKNSKVRELLGFEVFHFPYPQHALVCHFAHPYPHRGWSIEAFYPEGPFAILPLNGNAHFPHQSGLVWTSTPGEIKELSVMAEEDFNKRLSEKLDLHRYGFPRLISKRWTYPLSAHVTPTFISERTVLLGDAAHSIHPVAGQGLNLGIRDVEALSSEISKALSLGLDPGSSLFLENFQKSRRLDILSLLGITHGLIRLFSNHSKILKFLRENGLLVIDSLPSLKRFFVNEAMGRAPNA